MVLSKQQLRQFDKEGYLFLPDLFSAEEIAILRREAEGLSVPTAKRSGGRNRARRVPPSRLTPTTRRFAC